MAVHWQVKFNTLRNRETLTANIYDDSYTGLVVQLKGAAVPFETQEDDDNDLFKAIRTQSGYLRIVDDGTNLSGGSFNWHDLAPSNDTDRFVTLTNSNNTVLWQGYMQAQDFGSQLFTYPQERAFPLQGWLSVLSCTDIDVSAFDGIVNFAALLNYLLGLHTEVTIDHIYIQGGSDAMRWLLKKFDWSVFGEVNDDGMFDSRYDCLTVLEHMCRYWGWTARTLGTALYLTCADETTYAVNFLELTPTQLAAMAGGASGGTISTGTYSVVAIPDVFANTQNTEAYLRGCNKATVQSSVGDIGEELIFTFPDSVMEEMAEGGFTPDSYTSNTYYTPNLYGFETVLQQGTAYGPGSFNIMKRLATPPSIKQVIAGVIRQKLYANYSFATLVTKMVHSYYNVEFTLKGKAYYKGEEIRSTTGGAVYGNRHMYMRFGIGKTRETAMWWNGDSWQSNAVEMSARIGGSDGILYTHQRNTSYNINSNISTASLTEEQATGFLFVDFLGSDDVFTDPNVDKFELAEFAVTLVRPESEYRLLRNQRYESRTYTSQNDSVLRSEWSAETIFASDNYMKWGPGIVLNANNTPFVGWNYANHDNADSVPIRPAGYPTIDLGAKAQPEQHLADRVALYGQRTHRMVELQLNDFRTYGPITPRNFISINGRDLWPVAISHQWRDDILIIKAIEP